MHRHPIKERPWNRSSFQKEMHGQWRSSWWSWVEGLNKWDDIIGTRDR